MIHAEQTPFNPPVRSLSEMDRNQIVRETIIEIEKRMNAIGANHTYRQAFKVVVKILHGMKP